jgi:hypothetical protein
MSMQFVGSGMLIVWMIGEVSVLAAAAIAHALVRRQTSAAARHLLWALTVAGLPLLPMLSAVLPGWTVARPTRREVSMARRTRRLRS